MKPRPLKPGWNIVKFGDVVRQCKESVDRANNQFERYVEGGHMDTENIHIRRWGEFGDDYVGPAFHRIFRKGQVLYGSRRTYLKKVAIAEFDGITANTTLVLETRNQKIFMQELLPFLMLTDKFTEHSIRESKGSTNPYINWPDIAKFEFPLPPLEEQKRIAEILWAADEAIERHIEVKHSMEFLRNKFFIEKCLLGLTQQEMKDLNLTGHGWPVKRIRDCIKISSRKSTPPHKKAEYLSLENLDSGRFHITHKGNSKNVKSICSIYERGDLLYGKLRPNLDKAVIADRYGVCSTEILVITAKEITNNQFLLYHFHCPKFVSYNAHRAFGTKMPRTSMDIIGNYKIPVPPREIQANLLSRLETLTNQEREIDRHISTLKAIQLHYLNRIINGKHHV
jgi:type I restriction enzyme S subunit